MKRLLLAVAVVITFASTAFAQYTYIIPWVASGQSTVYIENFSGGDITSYIGFDGGGAWCGGTLTNSNTGQCNAPVTGWAWVTSTSSYVAVWANVAGTTIYPATGSTSFGFSGSNNDNGLAIANTSSSDKTVSITVQQGSTTLMSNTFTISANSSTGQFMNQWFPPGTYGTLPSSFTVQVSASWYFGAVATNCSTSPCSVVAQN